MLSYVSGYEIEFQEFPVQTSIPNEYRQNVHQTSVLQCQIDDLVQRNVVTEVDYDQSMFISNVFGRPKPNGDIRMIIDLSEVNEYVSKFHFKMDHLEVAADLLDFDMYMSSIDLKDAYYSIPIWENHKKFLTFQWKGRYFQFNVLPFGLTSAPRIFTKILKPVFSKMREEGFCVLGYIDDSLILGETREECTRATERLSQLLTELGFTINLEKSVLIPSKQITFLGYVLNSRNMTISPTEKKKQKALKLVKKLLGGSKFKIRYVASVIGLLVDLGKGVEYGANHFRYLERDKIRALKKSGPLRFEGMMKLSPEAKEELSWWKVVILKSSKKIRVNSPQKTLITDASQEGWGAVLGGQSTGGRWSLTEKSCHINVLEMKAVLFGLKSFCKNDFEEEILIKTDNTTAVSYINRMGGSRSDGCEAIAKEIWKFCESRELWLMASHIPGIDNEHADFMSRNFSDNTEWTLNQHIFEKICHVWGTPDVDLFASRLNHKVPMYVSWDKDPNAIDNNAFTLNWDVWDLIYLFPPFSLVSRCLRMIRRTKATVILVVPDWKGQAWFAHLRKPLVKDWMRFPPRKGNLSQIAEHLKNSPITEVPLLVVRC